VCYKLIGGMIMSRRGMAWPVAMLLAALAVACDDDQETAEGQKVDPARQLCEAAIAHDEECGREPQSLQDCMYDDGSVCFFDVVRTQVIADAASCVAEQSCGDDMLYCIYLVGEESPTEGQADFLSSCSARREACNESWGDYCESPYMTTALYDQMTACLSLDCAQIFDCMKGARPASCQ